MALSEANIIKVSQILNVPKTDIDYQITLMSNSLTAAVQSAIEAQITLWDAGAGTKTTKIHPTESNRGVETNPAATKGDIRRRIAVLLERPEWGGGSLTTAFARG
jgi:hypothetical protein